MQRESGAQTKRDLPMALGNGEKDSELKMGFACATPVFLSLQMPSEVYFGLNTATKSVEKQNSTE